MCKSLTRSARLRDRYMALTDSHLFVVNPRRIHATPTAASAAPQPDADLAASGSKDDDDDNNSSSGGNNANDDADSPYQPRMLPVFLIGRVVAPESDTVVRVHMVRRVGGRDQFAFVVPHRDLLLRSFAALGVTVEKQSQLASIETLLRERVN